VTVSQIGKNMMAAQLMIQDDACLLHSFVRNLVRHTRRERFQQPDLASEEVGLLGVGHLHHTSECESEDPSFFPLSPKKASLSHKKARVLNDSTHSVHLERHILQPRLRGLALSEHLRQLLSAHRPEKATSATPLFYANWHIETCLITGCAINGLPNTLR
jgi:hypothetical protein